jgi:hypothetical protein
MKKFRIIFTLLLMTLSVNLVNTGCDFDIDELSRSMDQANDTIRDMIPKILEDSDEWKKLITEEILPFIDHRLTWVIDDLKSLVEKTTQEIQAQAACMSDQLGPRVTNGLKEIMSNADGMRRSKLVFTMACSSSPSVIDLGKKSNPPRYIQVNGFDFVDRSAIQLFLSKNGQESIVVQDRIGWNSKYLLTVNISNWHDSMRAYDKLVLRYDGRLLTEVPILK